MASPIKVSVDRIYRPAQKPAPLKEPFGMTSSFPIDVEGVTNLQCIDAMPGWGYAGENWIGSVNGKYGVIRSIQGGWEYQHYEDSPWKAVNGRSDIFFSALPFELNRPNGFDSLYALATRLHIRRSQGDDFKEGDPELRLLAAVTQELTVRLYKLRRSGIPLRILEPTSIIFWADRSEVTKASHPKIKLFLPDCGFHYIGFDDGFAPAYIGRWNKIATNAGTDASFADLWQGHKLQFVNDGLEANQELIGVARLFAWLMDGKIRSSIPRRSELSSDSKAFWNQPRCKAWERLEPVLQTSPTAIPSDSNFFKGLSENSVATEFLISKEIESGPVIGSSSPRARGKWIELLVACIFVCLIAGTYYLRDEIAVLLRPKLPEPPFAICPDCTPANSLVYAGLEEAQAAIDALQNFESTFIGKKDRFTAALPVTLTRQPAPTKVQDPTFSDVETYVASLELASQRLLSVEATLAKSAQNQSSEYDTACLQRIAHELEIHLYQSCDSIGRLGNADNGLSRHPLLKRKIDEIAERISKHISLNPTTKQRLENTFD
jgi:hypothetical protein